MASGEIVEIKIDPYLKEYYIHRYGPEPIKLTASTKMFPLIAEYLTHKPKDWKPPVSRTDNLLFELPFNEVINVRCLNYINPRNYSKIRSFFYGKFYSRFISFMNRKVINEGRTIKHTIIDFIDRNGISWNTANLDTLQKLYFRYRDPKTSDEQELQINPQNFRKYRKKIAKNQAI